MLPSDVIKIMFLRVLCIISSIHFSSAYMHVRTCTYSNNLKNSLWGYLSFFIQVTDQATSYMSD